MPFGSRARRLLRTVGFGGGSAELQRVADALARLADTELRELVEAANKFMEMAPGLFSWIEQIANWELNRRRGLAAGPLPAPASLSSQEDTEGTLAALMLRTQFDDDSGVSGPTLALFDAIVGVLGSNCPRASDIS
jgi:hypothetical protein